MTRIAPVNLAYNPKTLWFDAGDLEIPGDAYVVVETARGIELGAMASDVFEGDEDTISALKSPLKAVKRIATDEDVERAHEFEEKSREAMVVFREVAAKHNENMHPVAVEYLLEGDKAVFYFEAEERLDFREIVRELASRFGVRIDMRQIGVRDEARMIGGIGHCGQELCCKRLGGEFCPVSIRMAKEQNLSLNPQKISGICGRLMCCLRYEYDAYKDFHTRAPKQNATVQTPDGPAKVASLNVPKEVVDLKIEIDGKMKTVHVPLADMDAPEEGARPKSVGEEAWRRAIEPPITSSAAALFLTSQFTGTDKLMGEARAVRRNNANVKNATGSSSMVELPKKGSGRRRRSRGGSSVDSGATAIDTTRVRRRRRSTTVLADGSKTVKEPGDAKETKAPREADESTKPSSRSTRRRRSRGGSKRDMHEGVSDASAATMRPGRKSSALSQAHDDGEKPKEGSGSRHRRRRRSSRPKPEAEGGSNEA